MTLPSRVTVVAVVLLVVASVLMPGVVAATQVSGAAPATSAQAATSDTDALAAVTNHTDSQVVVVRLEAASVEASLGEQAVLDRLQAHAQRTQQPVLDYAEAEPGVTVLEQFWLANAVVLRVSDAARQNLTSVLSARAPVRTVHANTEIRKRAPRQAAANVSPSVTATYAVEQVNATAVWERYDTRGAGTTVAVLSSGVEPSHPDIDLYTEDSGDPTFPGGWAEFDAQGQQIPGSEPFDPFNSGTAVSGVATGGNASGEAIGIAPEARLLVGKIFGESSDQPTATFAQVIGGMEWAVTQNADVMVFDATAGGFQPIFIEPVRNADAAGTLVTSLIGSGGAGTSGSPANVVETVGVGATDADRQVTQFSGGQSIVTALAWGNDAPSDWPDTYVVPDLVAPGSSVLSAAANGNYLRYTSTAIANGVVGGVAALVESAASRDLSPQETATVLGETAVKPFGESPDRDTRYGDGIPDALAAADRVADGVDPGGVTISLSNATVGPDGQGTTTLFTNASDVAGYQTRLVFDADVLQVENVVGEELPDPVVNVDNDLGIVSLTQSVPSGVDTPELASIEFSTEPGFGETEIGFDRRATLLNNESSDIPIDRFENATVRAGGDPPAGTTISLSDVQVPPGETATTTLRANASGVAGYQARITFDPSILQIESVSGGDFPAPVTNVDNDQGILFVTQATATGRDDPTLAVIEVRAASDASGQTTLSFDPARTRLNSVTGDIPIERFVDGTVTVGARDCLAGDANADGTVSSFDATLVARAIVGLPTGESFDPECADASGDGQLSSLDVTLILRTVAGLSPEVPASLAPQAPETTPSLAPETTPSQSAEATQ